MIGMLIAVVMTALALLAAGRRRGHADAGLRRCVGVLGGALGIGCVIGALLAARVAMTSMPELVAMLHSFVGPAAVLVGIATYLQPARRVDGGAAART